MGKRLNNFVSVVRANRGKIIKRTLIVGAGVAAVTIAGQLFKVKISPTDEAAELVDAIAEVVQKSVE
jgi:hypothetical protein